MRPVSTGQNRSSGTKWSVYIRNFDLDDRQFIDWIEDRTRINRHDFNAFVYYDAHNQHKRMGMARFSSREDAIHAVHKLHGTVIDEQPIHAELTRPGGNHENKRARLFPNLPPDTLSQLQIDDVGLFSVSDSLSADMLTEAMVRLLNATPTLRSPAKQQELMHEDETSQEGKSGDVVASSTSVPERRWVLTDGCACVGGNAISFAKHANVSVVYAVEYDTERAKMLEANAKLLGINVIPRDKADKLAANAFDDGPPSSPASANICDKDGDDSLIPSSLTTPSTSISPSKPLEGNMCVIAGAYADIISPSSSPSSIVGSSRVLDQHAAFFDPPWGGPDYRFSQSVELSLGAWKMEDLGRAVLVLCPATRLLVLKCPNNADEYFVSNILRKWNALPSTIQASQSHLDKAPSSSTTPSTLTETSSQFDCSPFVARIRLSHMTYYFFIKGNSLITYPPSDVSALGHTSSSSSTTTDSDATITPSTTTTSSSSTSSSLQPASLLSHAYQRFISVIRSFPFFQPLPSRRNNPKCLPTHGNTDHDGKNENDDENSDDDQPKTLAVVCHLVSEQCKHYHKLSDMAENDSTNAKDGNGSNLLALEKEWTRRVEDKARRDRGIDWIELWPKDDVSEMKREMVSTHESRKRSGRDRSRNRSESRGRGRGRGRERDREGKSRSRGRRDDIDREERRPRRSRSRNRGRDRYNERESRNERDWDRERGRERYRDDYYRDEEDRGYRKRDRSRERHGRRERSRERERDRSGDRHGRRDRSRERDRNRERERSHERNRERERGRYRDD